MEYKMLNVLCVKWGTKYSVTTVNRLYKNVKNHLTLPFNFYCLIDNPKGLDSNIKPIILKSGLEQYKKLNSFNGWWFKVEMFRPDLPIKGTIFYLDLDTVVVGNINNLVDYKNKFIIVRDFYRGSHNENAAQSCLMLWQHGKHNYIYEEFMKNPTSIMRKYPGGDQNWIEDQQKEREYWQDLHKDEIVSFKQHVTGRRRMFWEKESKLKENTKIVCFHGTPRPEDMLPYHAWLRENWV